jgi:hypothetical protein
MGAIRWREFVPASSTLLVLLLVVSRFVFKAAGGINGRTMGDV